MIALHLGCADGAPPRDPALADVVCEGRVNDVELEAVLATPWLDDPIHAAWVSRPDDGGSLPSSVIPTFRWDAGIPSPHASLSPAMFQKRTPRRTPLEDLFGGEKSAHADSAMSGPAYLLVFTDEHGARLLRVFTNATSYTPSEEAWAALPRDAWLTLTVTAARFNRDELAFDGGPFSGLPTTFTIDATQ